MLVLIMGLYILGIGRSREVAGQSKPFYQDLRSLVRIKITTARLVNFYRALTSHPYKKFTRS